MNTKKPSWLIWYSIVYGLMIVFVLVGLVFSIKTVSLNRSMRQMRISLDKLETENRRMSLQLMRDMSMNTLYRVATEELDMVRPKTIHYFTNHDERQ